jgi:hypothetical protein
MKRKFQILVICLFNATLISAQNADTLIVSTYDTSVWVDNYWFKKNKKIPISIEVVQRKSMYLGNDTLINGERKLIIKGLILTTLQDRYIQSYLKCCYKNINILQIKEISRNNMYYRDYLIDSIGTQSVDSIVYHTPKLISIYKKYHINIMLLFLGKHNVTISEVIIKNSNNHYITLEKQLPVYYLIKYCVFAP